MRSGNRSSGLSKVIPLIDHEADLRIGKLLIANRAAAADEPRFDVTSDRIQLNSNSIQLMQLKTVTWIRLGSFVGFLVISAGLITWRAALVEAKIQLLRDDRQKHAEIVIKHSEKKWRLESEIEELKGTASSTPLEVRRSVEIQLLVQRYYELKAISQRTPHEAAEFSRIQKVASELRDAINPQFYSVSVEAVDMSLEVLDVSNLIAVETAKGHRLDSVIALSERWFWRDVFVGGTPDGSR
ncbi:MAG: hypothetical protein AAF585_11220 [Verrucomicrobiota bacterium]